MVEVLLCENASYWWERIWIGRPQNFFFVDSLLRGGGGKGLSTQDFLFFICVAVLLTTNPRGLNTLVDCPLLFFFFLARLPTRTNKVFLYGQTIFPLDASAF